MSNILRTIIRFTIILIFLILLVFLSFTLFKIIPAGINQLATASLSITGLNTDKATTTSQTEDRIPQPVATTTGGLNGIIQSTGDIVISDKPTSNQLTPTAPRQPTRTVYYPTYTGLKNIKTNLVSVGIIDRFTGQFINTNSYNIDDTVVVKYQILNDQDTSTGPFSMRVDMPAIDINDRVKSINNINIPGKSSYNVEARFNGIDTNVNPTVRIYTDINGNVNETNENDNTLFVPINNVVNNNNYNNNWNNNNWNNNFSQPNLTITSIQTGRLINGSFFAQNNFNSNDVISVQLRVRNTGGSFTNTWSTRTTYNDNNGTFRERVTSNERYLSSGEETTLSYNLPTNIGRGNTTLNIQIDSNNNVFETNENDNFITTNVFVN